MGVDLVSVARFSAAIERTPRLLDRVFTVRELELSGGLRPRMTSLAGRWAAKEAVAKVLIDNRGLQWHHCELLNGERGEPVLALTGTVLAAAEARGIDGWHASLSHDGSMAIAVVIASRVAP